MRRTLHTVICLVVAMSIGIGTCVASAVDTQEDHVLHEIYADEIFAEYEKELAEIEAEYEVDITEINYTTLGQIQTAAVDYYGSRDRYVELVDAIAMAYDMQAALGTPGDITPFVNEKTEVRNYTSETVVPFGPIKGEWKDNAATSTSSTQGTTISGSYSFKIEGNVLGHNINGTYSYSDTFTLTGPARGTRLEKDRKYIANGCAYFAIAWGSIIESSWDVVEVRTGRVISHSNLVVFHPELKNGNRYCREYTPLYAEVGYEIVMDPGMLNADKDNTIVPTTSTWNNWNEIEEAAKKSPKDIVFGTD